MADPIRIGDGLTRFAVQTADGEKLIALDLIEATQQFNAISKKCEAEQLNNYEYLDQFSAWIGQTQGVKLNSSQAMQVLREMNRQLKGEADPPTDAAATDPAAAAG